MPPSGLFPNCTPLLNCESAPRQQPSPCFLGHPFVPWQTTDNTLRCRKIKFLCAVRKTHQNSEGEDPTSRQVWVLETDRRRLINSLEGHNWMTTCFLLEVRLSRFRQHISERSGPKLMVLQYNGRIKNWSKLFTIYRNI